jgi:hypothetical protein
MQRTPLIPVLVLALAAALALGLAGCRASEPEATPRERIIAMVDDYVGALRDFRLDDARTFFASSVDLPPRVELPEYMQEVRRVASKDYAYTIHEVRIAEDEGTAVVDFELQIPNIEALVVEVDSKLNESGEPFPPPAQYADLLIEEIKASGVPVETVRMEMPLVRENGEWKINVNTEP